MVSPHAKNRTGHGAGLTPSRHSAGQSKVKPLLERVGNWRDFLLGGVSEEEIERIGRHERTGGPLGNGGFVGKLEEALGRILQRQKPGRKKGDKRK
jgi:putative transposase